MPCNFTHSGCRSTVVTMAITTSRCGVCGTPETEEVFCTGHGQAVLQSEQIHGVWCHQCSQRKPVPADARLRILKSRILPPV